MGGFDRAGFLLAVLGTLSFKVLNGVVVPHLLSIWLSYIGLSLKLGRRLFVY